MKATEKETQRAVTYLRKRHIALDDIQSFRFMQRYTPEPETHSASNLYGPGLLTLQLKSGDEKVLTVHLRNHPTALIHTLLASGKPFTNYRPGIPQEAPQPTVTYRRLSLYMLWYFVLFAACFYLGLRIVTIHTLAGIVFSLLFFGMSLYSIYLLQARFCYLKLDADALTIMSAGREIRYAYKDLRKINFEFARELNATHVMELLDQDYRYRLFYIGRVPRKQLLEITTRLQQTGIDATCSLNTEKRHYHDVYHAS